MKRIFLCLIISLAFPVSASAASDKIAKETIASGGKRRTIYLFAPAGIKSPAPLILLLHGSGRNGNSLVEKWKDLAAKEGIVLVGPDAQDSRAWSMHADGPQFLYDLVESLKTKYQVNPRRVYLFGHSAGAVFALNMSMLESQYFAATAVHAGAWREPQEFQLMDYAERKIPLAIWVGDNDNFFPLVSVKETNARLRERGFPIEANIMKGHTHWYYDLAPQINRQAWDFLKPHELPADPKYRRFAQAKDTSQANQLLEQVNAQRNEAYDLTDPFNAREAELRGKDSRRDREQISTIAQEQASILKEAAAVLRAAAGKAEQLSVLKAGQTGRQYLLATARYDLKRAEMMEMLREQTELLLSSLPPDQLNARRVEVRQKVEGLQREADALGKKAEEVRAKGN